VSSQAAFRVNNFDLLRLLAATQVAVWHAVEHLGLGLPSTLTLLVGLFPGVPIFFFVSGFLISRSYENNPVLKEFFINRFFRIYPGLIFCNLISLGILFGTHYLGQAGVSPLKTLAWFVGQSSILQFYNPDFLRKFGVGVMNGSLWTITVEIQFYLAIPILYRLLNLNDASKRRTNVLLALFIGFAIINQFFNYYHTNYYNVLWYKILGVTFFPWFYMFIFGVLCQRNFSTLHYHVKNKGVPLFLFYVLVALIGVKCLGFGMGNRINLFLFLSLACAVLAIAYTVPSLAGALLKGNDISYGIYIFHMPVVNFCIFYRADQWMASILLVLATTFALAFFSWFIIEKPFLRLKRHALNPLK